MKIQVIAWAIGTIGILGMVACSKDCLDCIKKDEAKQRVCEKYYDSHAEYEYVLDTLEANGYTCRASY